jgi:hypothetical protein
MNNSNLTPPWIWPLAALILLCQATWIYLDARKRGERRFLWGLLGLVNCPSALIVYLLVTRVIVKTRQCAACGKRAGIDAKFCPHCGAAQGKPQ